MKKIGLSVIFLFAILACENSSKEGVKNEISSIENPQSSNINIETPKAFENRKIIWNADLEFQVKNVDKSTKEISSLCSKYDAFISHMNLITTNYEVSNNITIRVDNQNFNNLINEIKGISIFNRKIEISSNDVTEEFVDIKSRL